MSASAATPTGTISSSEISITERIRRKRFLTNLATNSGSNTSMVTVAIGPGSQITLMVRKLEEKRAAASNIKDRVNRQAVEDAYTSAIIKLQTLTQSDIGPTGLYLFSGMRENEKGIMKRVCELYKPLKTVSDFFYCDKNFQVDALLRELNNDPVFGFVIVDGAGTLYGTVQGHERRVLHTFDVDLPKKHSKGGQSSVRFARLREEKRANYVRKVVETMNQVFIRDGSQPIISGIIMAGSAEFKTVVSEADFIDYRLKPLILGVIDTSYGGEQGFNEAISAAGGLMRMSTVRDETIILSDFYERISRSRRDIVFGLQHTMRAYLEKFVKTLIIDQNCDAGVVRKNHITTQWNPIDDTDDTVTFVQSGYPCDMKLLDWLFERMSTHTTDIKFISETSAQGTQFVRGFGGIAAFLTYEIDIDSIINDHHDHDDKLISNTFNSTTRFEEEELFI